MWHVDIHSFELDGGTHKYMLNENNMNALNALNPACMHDPFTLQHYDTLQLHNLVHDMHNSQLLAIVL